MVLTKHGPLEKGMANNFRYADTAILMAESEEELKSPEMKVKEETEEAGLKLNIQETKIMSFGPITAWQTEREEMKAMTDFVFLAPKSLQMVITVRELKDVCSLEEIL